MPWPTPFDDPILLRLLTLKDAASYIMKLPKGEHSEPEWQAAMEALILVAESGGPTMLARIGVMRALNRHVERVFNPSLKMPHWAEERSMKIVWIYINTRYLTGDPLHICVFATRDAADAWFKDDPEDMRV